MHFLASIHLFSFPLLLFQFSPCPSSPALTFPLSYTLIFFLPPISLPISYPFLVYTSRHTLKGKQAFGSLELLQLQQSSEKQDDGLSSPVHAERNGCPQRTLPPGLAPGWDWPTHWTLSSRYLSVCRCMMSAQSSALRACLISLRWSRPEGCENTHPSWSPLYLDGKMIISLTLVLSSLQFKTSGKCFQNL